jgi:ATP-dependent helicase/nuclease subunit A
LQAPLVFLPDTLQTPRRAPRLAWSPDGDAMLWPPRESLRDSLSREWIDEARDRQDQEYRRLLYVAMTRAADRLYVCGWHTRKQPPEKCWYNLVRDALEPISDVQTVDDPVLAAAGPGVDSKVLRFDSAQTNMPDTASAQRPEPDIEPLPDWARTPPPTEPAPPVPLVPSAPVAGEPAARSPLAPEDRRAAERGRLIHRLLQSLPAVPAGDRHDACQRFLDRAAPDLDDAARADIAGAAIGVLAAPDFAPVFAPGSLAEVPIAGLLPGTESHVLSGQIDRLAISDEAVLVVDYKTNQRPPEDQSRAPEAYLRQMASYRAGLRAIFPERTVRCALVWTEGPRLMPLDDALLDRFAPNP